MILAGLFAGVLFLGLIVGDWMYFIRLTPDAVRYGCRVAHRPDQWPGATLTAIRDRFGPHGVLMLPHGVAWLYPELSYIAIRPQYRFFSRKFRTAWPVKGLIHLSSQDQHVGTLCVKRVPWSSALMTLIWFGIVLVVLDLPARRPNRSRLIYVESDVTATQDPGGELTAESAESAETKKSGRHVAGEEY